MKKTNKRTIIIIILIVLALIAGGAFTIIRNVRADRIPSNPPGTVGNTGGNLNNGGVFCEKDGIVYFANAFDDGTLYSMNVDETNIKKLSDSKVCNLLVGGNYLYYFQLGISGSTGLGGIRTPHSYVRSKLDGSKAVSLYRGVVVNAQLIDDTLFMLCSGDDGSYLMQMNTDRSEEKVLAQYIINPVAAADGKFYYNGTQSDHSLYSYDAASGISTRILNENIWYPCIVGNYIYYLDLGNDYQLRRYNLLGNSIEILSTDRVSAFNASENGYIYYQTMGDRAGIYCMKLDGSGAFLLSAGEFTDICTTSRYVYFKDFFNQNIIYHSALGSSYAEAFSGANQAVPEKNKK